jgi:hypothetical protein
MKGNVIQMNTLHLNSVRLNGIGKVQSVSLKGGSTEDPVFPPVEPPVEPEPTPTYTLSASVSNGIVSATLNGIAVSLPYVAQEGEVIVLSVTPNDGYAFEGWADGNTDNPRTITMNADKVLSAQCVEVVQPPVGNYIQFEDKAVEAICVANWSSDGIGLTEEDAAKVTSVGTIFRGNKEITSFNEFRYFINVQKIGHKENENYGAFKGCSNLRSIALPDSCYSIGYGAFGDCASLTSISYGNVTEIGSRAFRNCTSLSGALSFPYLTTLKGDGFFAGTNISSFSAPLLTSISGHSSLGDYGAFANCSALATVGIPSVVNIGPHTFYKCTSLGVVELLVVTGIGNAAFHSCTNLQSVIVRTSTPPTLGSNVFYGSTCPIYVPDASLEAYKGATNWNTYADRIHPLSEIEDYYVSDALLMHFDGINKGNVEGEWQDLVSGNTFVNHGAIAEADGWRFDGASSYMNSTNMASYGPGYGNRTFEIVAEFERENTTEVVYMGAGNGYAFGRYAGGKSILLGSNVGLPSLADDMTSGVRIVSVSTTTALQIVASKINGNNAQVGINNHFDGGVDIIYLGKRASGTHFKGIIHSIRIHNRILSEEEILYNQRIDNKRFNLGLDI